ncbi:unnamed protein product [Cunninghamella blakesleeana]
MGVRLNDKRVMNNIDDQFTLAPPPYNLIHSNFQSQQYTQHHQLRKYSLKKRLYCVQCQQYESPNDINNVHCITTVGPYLIQHYDKKYWINLCPCQQHFIHASCLSDIINKKKTINRNNNKLNKINEETEEKESDGEGSTNQKEINNKLTCQHCKHEYQLKWRYLLTRIVIICVHLLSIGSVIGLINGLIYIGRTLDELGLGSEMGSKLDGDENWQDHEMQEIAAWLNMVHLVTALSGEALLGLVYMIGVYSLCGIERTLQMIHAILYVNFGSLLHKKDLANTCLLWFILVTFGLLFGTYLLFFSWVWAYLFHLVCHRILIIRPSQHTSVKF